MMQEEPRDMELLEEWLTEKRGIRYTSGAEERIQGKAGRTGTEECGVDPDEG